ncbi:MAG: TetR/AcrR family transcriptional regulator [Alphaproteobacteria bacterium]|nr:TetR/AcrR family transcriptional regulator [Alphaproteobacteria bacterium]
MTNAEPRIALIERLFELFRVKGYHGVSIADVSEATGLGRSSLYHYFPRGKEEMAEAVIAYARAALTRAVFTPLVSEGPLEARIDGMLSLVSQLYAGGETPCVLASLLSSEAGSPIAEAAARLLCEWTAALAKALRSAGVAEAEALRRASLALGQIQGALVLVRATKRREAFLDALGEARAILIAGAHAR